MACPKQAVEVQLSDRRVTATAKDDFGEITMLCDAGASWSPRHKSDVIKDIESKSHSYYVHIDGYPRIDVYVSIDNGGKEFRTTKNVDAGNHLGNLPDC